MSNENQETIEDIVSEMRIGDLCASDTSSRSMYINDFLASYADRIEAAHNREVEELKRKAREANLKYRAEKARHTDTYKDARIKAQDDEIANLKREVSDLRRMKSVTDCNHLGNAAKMREALEKADAVLRLISKSAWFIDANFAVTKAVIDACNAIEASLAELPRNCDRYINAKDALKAFERETGESMAIEFIKWLFAEAKGATNESK